MTPISNAVTEGQRTYNTAHMKCRNPIERCNGVLKQRFRCLLKERQMRYSPEKAGLIINACAVLHNILVQAKFPLPEEIDGPEDMAEPNCHNANVYSDDVALRDGILTRDNLILNNFL